MKITRDQVEHIALLARLEFSAKELEAFTRQMDTAMTSDEDVVRLGQRFLSIAEGGQEKV